MLQNYSTINFIACSFIDPNKGITIRSWWMDWSWWYSGWCAGICSCKFFYERLLLSKCVNFFQIYFKNVFVVIGSTDSVTHKKHGPNYGFKAVETLISSWSVLVRALLTSTKKPLENKWITFAALQTPRWRGNASLFNDKFLFGDYYSKTVHRFITLFKTYSLKISNHK